MKVDAANADIFQFYKLSNKKLIYDINNIQIDNSTTQARSYFNGVITNFTEIYHYFRYVLSRSEGKIIGSVYKYNYWGEKEDVIAYLKKLVYSSVDHLGRIKV